MSCFWAAPYSQLSIIHSQFPPPTFVIHSKNNMKNKIALLLILLCCYPYSKLVADAAPKPSMRFTIVFEGMKSTPITNGWQLESGNHFKTFDTIQQRGPQGFWVDSLKAHSLKYGSFSEENRLLLEYDNQRHESNTFGKHSFSADYVIHISPQGVNVVENPASRYNYYILFLWALFLTLTIELLTAFIFNRFLKVKTARGKLLKQVAIINCITLPIVWFVGKDFLDSFSHIVIVEILVFMAEAIYLRVKLREQLGTVEAIVLSFIMNLISAILGGAILLIISLI